MQKSVTVQGQEVKLGTITVGTLEQIELGGKKGYAFNAAFIAASILTTGDKERGTVEWVRALPAFESSFGELMDAANEVNGFQKPKAPGEAEPAAPAAV